MGLGEELVWGWTSRCEWGHVLFALLIMVPGLDRCECTEGLNRLHVRGLCTMHPCTTAATKPFPTLKLLNSNPPSPPLPLFTPVCAQPPGHHVRIRSLQMQCICDCTYPLLQPDQPL